ncbi:hypothetical protein [Algibacter luteus]|uniref:hypothetical protein n=1 Tax=Algibacter luteus TaxID=1178825 RepID=UPI0025980CEE|nr:hypothetical protein [Algibacter luteus]WJJ96616.1 hypothetical protein O5O44_15485 [Algibacter luteus]
MKILCHILLIFFMTNFAFSQSSKTDSISKSKISELQFMVGKWEGSGWMMGRQGKSNFVQTEDISFKLDSTAIHIEGKGMANGKTIHDALAILTYNKNDDNYLFRSYLPSGQNAEFKAELIDSKLYWYPNENVRYIIWLTENGQWYEKGEYQREGNWNQFFEMTLDKNE